MTRSESAIKSLKRIPALQGILRTLHKTLFLGPTLQEKMMRALSGNRSVFFVQVGANDGVKADPIHDLIAGNKNWNGIFIEPIGSIFQRLKHNYANSDRFIFENVAISAKKETRAFYYLSEKAGLEASLNLPFYFDQLGSFDKNHLLKHFDGRIEPFIIEEEMECVPLQEVLDRNQVATVDLLHIDVEGFDYQVLAQVDFARYKPLAILYEHKHLLAEELVKAEFLLEASGYRLFRYDADTLAIRRRINHFWRSTL
jgi:FkbM family methyltransferase